VSELTPRLPPHAADTILQFLRAHAGPPNGGGVVVGLSGGIDSALTARLARDALGPDRVLGVLLPDPAFPAELREETEAYARSLGLEPRTIVIEPAERAFRGMLPELTDRVEIGNLKARIRMITVYALARRAGRLVVGTGNKSELLVGYFTKWGDGGADLLPIGDLYKTEIRALAAELGLPRAIRDRPPTAGLWEGQTDEGELGIAYDDLDRILVGFERLLSDEEIATRTGLPLTSVRSVGARVRATRHKRRLPPIPKIGLRTVGLDWRE
jgi:NAD+ synthase